MAAPSPLVIAQGKMEAIEAVRRVITSNRGQGNGNSNPLGLPLGVDGKPVELALVSFQGEEERERCVRCNILCTFLANQPRLVHSFNGLSHVHQTLVLILQEPGGGEPHPMKEWFLGATGPQ